MKALSCRGDLRSSQSGFTLIELIMVIVILGVLAVFAAPRIFQSSDFFARGLHDETLALLRYAQKAAIAQRRMVCVTFDTVNTPNTVVLTTENPTPTNSPLPVVNCNANLAGPRGESPATVTARSGTSYSGATNVIFNGLGQPVSTSRAPLASNISISFTGAADVTVEAVTGYVHD